MLIKDVTASFKAAKDDAGEPTGEVTAIVSVFGNVDLVGDRVVKGAFADSLESWKESGDPIPMLWSHDWSNPMSHIGSWDASKAVETDEGLELTGTVDIKTGNPIADQAFKLMSNRLVREFSFAYDVLDEKGAEDGANELLSLSLIEAGPTLKGANSETRLLAAKALVAAEEAKAGRTISAKNETTLRDAVAALKSAIGALDSVLEGATPDDAGDEAKAVELEVEPTTEPEPIISKSAPDVRALLSIFDAEAFLDAGESH